ncbi:cytochrome P450 [Xylariomycetidae sp. FL2044]|nr:cytochrome P450 [Xylariomycetidae sp. FL2044]
MSFFHMFIVGILILSLPLYWLGGLGKRPAGCPPGPRTLPFIGNLHQLPRENVHIQFQTWARQYGPVFSLVLGGKIFIVLSSDTVVKDLLDKRSSIYSSRPDNYIAQDVLSGGLRILLLKYGDTWKGVRKVAYRILNVKVSRAYVPYQELESKALLDDMLHDPSQFANHIRRYSTSIMTQMAYGYRLRSTIDPRLEHMFQIGALLDFFPLLRYLPSSLLPIKRMAEDVHQKEYELFLGHFYETKRKVTQQKSKPCFCADLVHYQHEEGYSDHLAGYLSGSLLQAGSETTSAILLGFMQALAVFPSIVCAAHQELDSICGNRVPDLHDLPKLPYIRGCMKEALRFMPATLLGVPHATTAEDVYRGYTIPKGATVIYNVWAIHNDPLRYPLPRRFDPTRWAEDHQTSAQAATNPDVSKRDHFAFGAGRRLCQGMHIADTTLFLAIARLLWAFNFQRYVNDDGKEEVPNPDDLVHGLFTMPKAFKMTIVPREGKAEIVEEEWTRVSQHLGKDGQWNTVPEGLPWGSYEEDKE